ncbi:hypothetical protein [Mucilaginibacter glaciei]|uniref:Addiction module component n=1 Tax=Mucilaginibacter glaciei TaxID=2772109 RepID=A0A926NQ66_9SPHI|nr:hypothetical protein [Mucilaginibacter glaciei]MBD1393916.1 hypothetical protein [Mucilaginibacter glaciei]
MTIASIREKLHDFIDTADDERVKAIYTLVRDEPANYEWTADKNFVAELDDRLDKLNSGEDAGRTWNDIEASIEQLKSKRNIM